MKSEADDLPNNDLIINRRHDSSVEDEIDFLGSQSYFVCFIDIVNSTQTISRIDSSYGIRKYYGIFLNTIGKITRSYGGRIVKNGGDSLIFYFQSTAHPLNSEAFKNALECCFEIINSHSMVNLLASYENLPRIDYRISADYGKVEVARSRSSREYDLIGNTMNICAKMNSIAKPQGLVIGGDLYEILKGLKFPFANHYEFHATGEYSAGLRYNYPIFAVQQKNNASGRPVQHPSEIHKHRDGNKHRIILVDDEPDVLLTYKSMLEGEEFEVETYTSSQQALQQLLSKGLGSCDLIITDIRMPPPNGLQLYNVVKSLDKRTKVLFITAYDVIEEVLSMLPEIKHEQVLKKPIDKHDLIKEAKQFIELC